MAKALPELADKETTFISLRDLALPFATHIAEHLPHSDKQATSATSKFLQTCRDFNQGTIDDGHNDPGAEAVALLFESLTE